MMPRYVGHSQWEELVKEVTNDAKVRGIVSGRVVKEVTNDTKVRGIVSGRS